MKLYSPATVKYITDKYRFHFQKNLGQNFLVDGNIVQKIVDAADLSEEDVVLEIGAGIGTLTRALAEKAAKVVVIEIDKNLRPVLKETLADCDNVEVAWGNALKIDFDNLMAEKTENRYGRNARPYKVVANLPYYITTPLIMYALENQYNLDLMVVMIQKEVAQRITGSPGGKEYGVLTLGVSYYTEPQMLFNVSKQVFIPQPEVESTVVRLKRRNSPPVEVEDKALLFEIIRSAFGQRRKTLANALTTIAGNPNKTQIISVLANLDIDPGRRGETLSISEFADIANAFSKINSISSKSAELNPGS